MEGPFPGWQMEDGKEDLSSYKASKPYLIRVLTFSPPNYLIKTQSPNTGALGTGASKYDFLAR